MEKFEKKGVFQSGLPVELLELVNYNDFHILFFCLACANPAMSNRCGRTQGSNLSILPSSAVSVLDTLAAVPTKLCRKDHAGDATLHSLAGLSLVYNNVSWHPLWLVQARPGF